MLKKKIFNAVYDCCCTENPDDALQAKGIYRDEFREALYDIFEKITGGSDYTDKAQAVALIVRYDDFWKKYAKIAEKLPKFLIREDWDELVLCLLETGKFRYNPLAVINALGLEDEDVASFACHYVANEEMRNWIVCHWFLCHEYKSDIRESMQFHKVTDESLRQLCQEKLSLFQKLLLCCVVAAGIVYLEYLFKPDFMLMTCVLCVVAAVLFAVYRICIFYMLRRSGAVI